MYDDFTYEATLAASLRAQWQLDDVLRADQELDFSRNFLPESLARTGSISWLDHDERRLLNQICAYQYLYYFGAFEEFIAPFVVDHAARPARDGQAGKQAALSNFAEEEKKHTALFDRYCAAFRRGFPVRCKVVNTRQVLPETLGKAHPLAAAMFVLLFEWMTQSHYVDSVRDDTDIDPLFKSLLKHHWMEEAQHAKLDTLMVGDIAATCTPADMELAADHLTQLFLFMNKGFALQAGLNVATLEEAIGRRLDSRQQLISHVHRAALWSFIGCGIIHRRFRATMRSVLPAFAEQVEDWTRRQFHIELAQLKREPA